jgi:hypothetical protein
MESSHTPFLLAQTLVVALNGISLGAIGAALLFKVLPLAGA